MLLDALKQVNSNSLTLLGVLIDANGQREAFVHNCGDPINTKNLGICYVAGSGKDIVEQIILDHDQQQTQFPPKPGVIRRMSATEDLAERIASQALYRESDIQNGRNGTSIYSRCGGFYEWYKVEKSGVLPLRSRLDLHITELGEKLAITRAYYAEQLQLPELQAEGPHSQKYSIHVLNLGLVSIEPEPTLNDWWQFVPEECHGVKIESTFELYDAANSSSTQSGPVGSVYLESMFGKTIPIKRMRLICHVSGVATIKSFSRDLEGDDVLAKIIYVNGHACIQMSGEIISSVRNSIQILRNGL